MVESLAHTRAQKTPSTLHNVFSLSYDFHFSKDQMPSFWDEIVLVKHMKNSISFYSLLRSLLITLDTKILAPNNTAWDVFVNAR